MAATQLFDSLQNMTFFFICHNEGICDRYTPLANSLNKTRACGMASFNSVCLRAPILDLWRIYMMAVSAYESWDCCVFIASLTYVNKIMLKGSGDRCSHSFIILTCRQTFSLYLTEYDGADSFCWEKKASRKSPRTKEVFQPDVYVIVL